MITTMEIIGEDLNNYKSFNFTFGDHPINFGGPLQFYKNYYYLIWGGPHLFFDDIVNIWELIFQIEVLIIGLQK